MSEQIKRIGAGAAGAVVVSLPVRLPLYTRYVAQDASGAWLSFSHPPEPYEPGGTWVCREGLYDEIGRGEPPENFLATLRPLEALAPPEAVDVLRVGEIFDSLLDQYVGESKGHLDDECTSGQGERLKGEVDEFAAEVRRDFEAAMGARVTCGCGLPMSRNPHPRAGEPAVVSEVGAAYVCVPCTMKALHGWSGRALAAERLVAALRPLVVRLRDALEYVTDSFWSHLRDEGKVEGDYGDPTQEGGYWASIKESRELLEEAKAPAEEARAAAAATAGAEGAR